MGGYLCDGVEYNGRLPRLTPRNDGGVCAPRNDVLDRAVADVILNLIYILHSPQKKIPQMETIQGTI